jgi:outer membrane protein assembly factor BamB
MRGNRSSRRRFLALAVAAAGAGPLAGCGYRPGGGDVRWEHGTGTGTYRPDDLLATGRTAFTVNRSVRGFDFDAEEWSVSADIAAYDAASGGPTWEETTPPCGRPAASGGRLYVGHEDDGLVAFADDGERLWEIDVGDFPRTVAARDDRVYALTEAGDLHAFAADDGDQSWRTTLEANEETADDGEERTPTADRATLTTTRNGVLVHYRDGTSAGGGTTEVAVFGTDGDRRWTTELVIEPSGRAAADDETGAVYVPSDRVLHAVSLDDGSERWSQGVAGIKGTPVVADGRLYHVGGGALYARSPKDGSLLWQVESDGLRGFSSSPAVADGRVYVGAHDAVYAIAAEDGTVVWQVESGRVTDAPRVVAETVVVSTSDGDVRGHWRG